MSKVTKVSQKYDMRPALDPEAEENIVISMAYDLAKKQIAEGTASSQVITHFLKLGSSKERIEKEILAKQKELLDAKTKALESAKRVEDLYANALKAFKDYSGHNSEEEEDEDDEY